MKSVYMIKRISIFFIATFIFQSCQQGSENSLNQSNPLNDSSRVISDSLTSDTNSIVLLETALDKTCSCEDEVEELPFYTDLTFSNNGKPFDLDSLERWKNNPEKFKIKSLRLRDFDTIPVEMALFENVEYIFIEAINYNNTQGLELFPKLRKIRAEGERFLIDENSAWISKIEIFHANKTEISGLKSFKQMPNLKEMKISFSGFDVFPSDFSSLKCLNYFQTGAHTFGEIDLSKLDLSEMPCLKFVEFHSWRTNIKGIPTGIDQIETVKISHGNLTKTEKEKLKSLN